MGIVYLRFFVRNVVARQFGSIIGLPGKPFLASNTIVVGIVHGWEYFGRDDDVRAGTPVSLALSQQGIAPRTSNGPGTYTALGQFKFAALVGSRHRRSIMRRCRIPENQSSINAAVTGVGENGPLFVRHQSRASDCAIVSQTGMCVAIKPAKPPNPFDTR